MVLLFSFLAAIEFFTREDFRPKGLLFWLGLTTVILMVLSAAGILPWLTGNQSADPGLDFLYRTIPVFAIFFLLSGVAIVTGNESPAELFKRHSRLVWGVAYIGLLYPFVFALGDQLPKILSLTWLSGGDLLLFLFGILWVGDTTAMWIGSAIGKRKLAPAVSPNKTVEGFLGGLVGAVAVGILMSFWLFEPVRLYHLLLIAVGCSVFGQLGDLVESMWKRSLGIKDSSSIIPGHGGILDRFDSLLFAAPFMYAYMIFFFR
jgi:phosphatidate cytidylyltransferase